jgi:ABC-type phosphate transport system substrate-binding protein
LPDRRRRTLLLGLGAAGCVPTWAASPNVSDGAASGAAVRIGGTGAGVDALAQLFGEGHGGLAVSVVPSLGSSGGIKALLAGVLDAALIARPLKPE